MNKKLSITKSPDDKEIIIFPSTGTTHTTLFWLHRAGECSETYDEIFFHGDVPSQHGIKVRILEAPVRVITFKQYREECAWFDINAIYDQEIVNKPEEQIFNFEHLNHSIVLIRKQIEEQVEIMKSKGVTNPYSKIYIGGAGQGATMALHYALTSKQPLSGVIAVGGYLLKSSPLNNLNTTKFYLLNGQKNEAIPQNISRNSYEPILNKGNIKYRVLKGEGDQFTQTHVKKITKFISNNIYFHH